ncbi:MAG: beta strand repeat-containing protein [Alphaproteobacteria bacterium]
MATVIGTDGNDGIFADGVNGVGQGSTAGVDDIDGRAGSDTINGGLGADVITGGAGQDFFFGNILEQAGDRIEDFTVGLANEGGDRISVQFDTAPTVTLGTQGNDLLVNITAEGLTRTVTLAGLGTLSNPGVVVEANNGLFAGDIFITNTGGGQSGGGDDDDGDAGGGNQGGGGPVRVPTVTGTEGPDFIAAELTDGDDIIAALGGNDIIVSSPGNDVIITGAGSDNIFGQAGTLDGTIVADFTTGTPGSPEADFINISLAQANQITTSTQVSGSDLLLTVNTNGVQDTIILEGLGVQGAPVTVTETAGTPDGTALFVTINTNNNVAPTATDDVFAAEESVARTGNVITGDNGNGADSDTDAIGNPLTVTQVSVGGTVTAVDADATSVDLANGTLLIDPDGDFTYTSDAGFTGTDTLTYTITDGLATDTADVTFNVGSGNTPPTPQADTFTGPSGSALTRNAAQGVLANDTDPEGDTLTVAAVNGVAASVGTTVTLTDGGAAVGSLNLAADGSFTFTPTPGSTGATFNYTASDGTDTATATVTITLGTGGGGGGGTTLEAVNDVFDAEEDQLLTVNAADGLLANDSGSNITITQVNGQDFTPDQTVALNGGLITIGLNGDFVFENAQGNEDPITFDYVVTDGSTTDTATVTIEFDPVFTEIGSDANETFDRRGSTQDNSLDAAGGNDRVITGAGNDTISGGAGNDFIDDIDDQDAGENELFGGDGDDVMFGRAGSYEIDGGAGNDVITVYAAVGTNSVQGGDGNDTIELRRGTDNTIDGGAGDDTILIRKTIFNEIGLQNTVLGGDGNDTIEVRDGYQNTIIGGAGDDVLIGGSGGDTFQFSAGFGSDTVRNFGEQGADKMDLSAFAGLDFATFLNDVTETTPGTFVWSPDSGDTLTIEGLPFDSLSSVFFIFDGS